MSAVSKTTEESHTPGVRPADWIQWPTPKLVGIISAAAALVVAVLVIHAGSWIVVLLVGFALVTPLIAAIDLRWRVVPNRIVMPATVAAALLAAGSGFADGDPSRVLGALAGGAGMFGIYFVLALIAPGAMGMGDVKLAALIGIVAGALAWPGWFIALLLGFVVGAVIGLCGLLLRSWGTQSSIPYAPAMLAGAWIAAIGATAFR